MRMFQALYFLVVMPFCGMFERGFSLSAATFFGSAAAISITILGFWNGILADEIRSNPSFIAIALFSATLLGGFDGARLCRPLERLRYSVIIGIGARVPLYSLFSTVTYAVLTLSFFESHQDLLLYVTEAAHGIACIYGILIVLAGPVIIPLGIACAFFLSFLSRRNLSR